MSETILSFYRFAPLPQALDGHVRDLAQFRDILTELGRDAGVTGTILIAPEGLNATIAGPRCPEGGGPERIVTFLRGFAAFADMPVKRAVGPGEAFYRFKVRLKRELITMGVAANPARGTGMYVEPGAWNTLLQDPQVLVLDTRNRYEVAMGSFAGARDPQIGRFRELAGFLDQCLDPRRQRAVAMFCTGGIRCEKASSWLLERGFEAVYQLRGGILAYLETMPPEHSLWHGECFVFDNRVSVRPGLQPGSFDLCHACRHPISAADKASTLYEPGAACPHCADRQTPARRASHAERERQVRIANARGARHIGPHASKS